MIGRAPHQPERRLRPGLGKQSASAQVGVAARNLVGAQHWRAGLRRRKRHALTPSGPRRNVVAPRDRPRRRAERDMLGDILDALTIDEHLPAVVERAQIIRTGSHESSARFFEAQPLTPPPINSTSFCGVIGVCAMRTPNAASASSMAEIIAGAAGTVPPSPAPLAPSGLSGEGVCLKRVLIAGTSIGLGRR